MKIIVGLGNPGKKFENTVHNAGFNAINLIAEQINSSFSSSKHSALVASGKIKSESIILVKPLTFMNLSGGAVNSVAKYYKVEPENIIVLHDDIDLQFGEIKTKIGGGDAGHNGLKSITSALKTSDYHRVRIGVGRGNSVAGEKNASDWVLQELIGQKLKDFQAVCEDAANFCQELI